jgi:hypothetical protein
MAPQRPLGFWLKLLDRLINEQFEAVLDEHGVTRRQWQVLSLLSSDPATRPALRSALAPFLTGAEPEPLDEELAELVASDWVGERADHLELTERGRTALARLGEVVGRGREALARDVSAEEYDQTLQVLERMARNLGWTDPVTTEQ